ncbi:hypothetical protein AQ490_18865 [Wenjunlia vitaminophila]|uniref:Uncharacterized protein n=1 Tax=Wenjunlia vitaminophila TaxID=76728 RepID=A0A0T6LV89_WENVI|nr:hypothetical protein [Wenjunlia vitaminophila]KRV49762.1 hypothetical protein AQ490_18865 [Wenjunlia vitaminophila]
MPHPSSGLSDAQRRAVLAADPDTGRLSAAAVTCAALRTRGLAYRHARSPAHYLTEAGRALRSRLLAPVEEPGAGTPAVAADPSGFAAATGQEGGVPTGPGRQREVAAAWAALLQIRGLLQGGTDCPAEWERSRPVHAAALALEAAGLPPAPSARGGGYRVAASPQPDAVRVSWSGPGDRLNDCAAALSARGWQPTRHTDRSGAAFLLVSPRRRSPSRGRR